ncbi:MAG: glycosyltransferase, partial [Lentisphaerae bacterium]|nr:glycosyltransferase [Lentisphaerota bacterium]
MTIEFAKYNRDRLPRFQIETVILREAGRRRAVKRALTPEARGHIRNLREGYRRLAEHIVDPALRLPALLESAEDRLTYEFVPGPSLDRLLFSAFFNRDPGAFWAVLDDYWRLLKTGFRTSEKLRVGAASAAVFGGLDLSPLENERSFFALSFLDAIFDNLIKTDDGYVLIDNEWILDDALPVSFVLFRSVNELHRVRGAAFGLERFVPMDNIWSRYGLAPERVDLYRRMEEAFQSYVFGAERLFQARNRYLKPAHQVPILRMSVIPELEGRIGELQGRIGELQGQMGGQLERIVELQEEVRKRGEWGKSLDVIIHSLEKQVRDAAGVILSHEQRDKEAAELAERQNAEIVRLNGVVGAQQAQLQHLHERGRRLDTIERSFSWKLISGVCRLVDEVLPPHSFTRFAIGRFGLGLFNLCRPWRWNKGFTVPGARRFFLYTEGRQAFPVFAAPEVSVIVPVHNKWEFTQDCLRSLLAHSPGVSYEVIVADDASTDTTRFHRRFFQNIRVIRNRKSLGFLVNCNRAAREARGQFLFFLNNDTRVEEGAIRRLLDLFRQDGTIGVAGSKLVYPDGRLQEAGGILWRDATGWNFGRFQDPARPEFNYVKEVDYVSGAAMMVRKSLWDRVGGFDARYTPAYFEDADLAFEARRHGFTVVYQPASCVVHVEGVSHGVDETAGAKKYQVINRDKFLAKWRVELERDQYANGQHVFRARDRSRRRKTLLVIDHYAPKYDQDAGSRTTFQYLKLFLDAGLNVKFIGDNFHRDERYTAILEQLGIEVLYGVWYFQHWQAWIRENAADLDYVLFNRPHITAKYLDFIRA